MTTPNGSRPPGTDPDGAESRPVRRERYWTPGRLALGALVTAFIAFWGWIYLFAPRGHPDRLESREFAATAELISGRSAPAIAKATRVAVMIR